MEKEQYPTCTCGKVSFPSHRTAMNVVNFFRNNKKAGKKKIPKRDYFCKDCSAWHLTSRKSK